MQGHSFEAQLTVLPLEGYDAVLGVDWLKMHNPVTLDFEKLCLAIKKGTQKIRLQGTTEGALRMINGKSLHKLFTKAKQGLQGYLMFMGAKEGQPAYIPEVRRVLQKYKGV